MPKFGRLLEASNLKNHFRIYFWVYPPQIYIWWGVQYLREGVGAVENHSRLSSTSIKGGKWLKKSKLFEIITTPRFERLLESSPIKVHFRIYFWVYPPQIYIWWGRQYLREGVGAVENHSRLSSTSIKAGKWLKKSKFFEIITTPRFGRLLESSPLKVHFCIYFWVYSPKFYLWWGGQYLREGVGAVENHSRLSST